MTINTQQLTRIADRYIELRQRHGAFMPHIDKPALRAEVKLKLIDWNSREPLNFDVLERFPDVDFAHDLGGIMRDDTLMSARSALIYHPVRDDA